MENSVEASEIIDRKVIVIVEDNEDIAELLKDTLNGEPDYQAVAVHDSSRALEVIRSVQASLVLLDVMLPGIDGLQLYDMLREDPMTADVPVIFVTATEHNEEFSKRRIRHFIAKPFNITEVLSAVAAICRPEQ
jgi:DNA-binding response OmpR family regulator